MTFSVSKINIRGEKMKDIVLSLKNITKKILSTKKYFLNKIIHSQKNTSPKWWGILYTKKDILMKKIDELWLDLSGSDSNIICTV